MIIGAQLQPSGTCEFVVWAPFRTSVELQLLKPEPETIGMEKDDRGYWRAVVEGVSGRTRYRYRLDRQETRPDPASHSQPDGVHGASEVVDHASFRWEDHDWNGMDLRRTVQYELHVGAFSPEGTFDAVIPRLDDLRRLGVTTIELMPLAQFPGERNWGYDGAYPFAVQHSYGGADGLKRLVNACHARGMSVILDVVYNHLGPEGNYTGEYGPYFTDRYRTPWGRAINFDGPYSDEVRNFFVENALTWFMQYHIDALRLDAVHAIFDMSARHILRELSEATGDLSSRQGREYYLIAESDLSDTRVVTPYGQGGYGVHAQWLDDLHHGMHTLLTGESDGYYRDFGKVSHLVKCLKEGFVHSGQYSPFRRRRHGNSSAGISPAQFVVFSQNHDQVGNRMKGERLSSLTSFEGAKLAAALEILSPSIPLLFMGEEYAEEAPFMYFVSHSDAALIDAVRKGRREEFEQFVWSGEPPDPQSPETFERSHLHWELRTKGRHATMLSFYARLLEMRREIPALSELHREGVEVEGSEKTRVVMITRAHGDARIVLLMNFAMKIMPVDVALPRGPWKKVLDSSETTWSGPGTVLPENFTDSAGLRIGGYTAAVYQQERHQ